MSTYIFDIPSDKIKFLAVTIAQKFIIKTIFFSYVIPTD